MNRAVVRNGTSYLLLDWTTDLAREGEIVLERSLQDLVEGLNGGGA